MKITLPSLLLTLGLVLGLASARSQAPAPAADPLGWQLAVHSYTFKNFTIEEAIRKTAALGLKYISISGKVSFDGTTQISILDLGDDQIAAIRKKAADAGLTIVNLGVLPLEGDEAKCRRTFETAKKFGVNLIVSEPTPEVLDTVLALCKEYQIRVAIHDHPKPSRYWNPDTVLAAINGRTPWLGACADTGHWLRSGLDPVECLKKLDGHVLALHFKDLTEADPKGHDVPWGTGVGNLRGQMEELKRQGFRGAFCVEYEYHWDDSVPEIAQSVKFFDATRAELAAVKP